MNARLAQFARTHLLELLLGAVCLRALVTPTWPLAVILVAGVLGLIGLRALATKPATHDSELRALVAKHTEQLVRLANRTGTPL